MPDYVYKGKTTKGEKVSGKFSAESEAALKAYLQRKQITPIKIGEKGKQSRFGKMRSQKVTAKELAIFLRQFSVMIDAGLPLVQCLEILSTTHDNPTFAKTLADVRSNVESGSSFANALRAHPKVFDALMINMIEAGEVGGILEKTLQRLATYVEKGVKIKIALKSALIYPITVVSIAALVITLLLWKVVPIFTGLFSSLGAELPLPTRIVVGTSNAIGHYGWIFILAGIAFYFAFKRIYASKEGRLAIDRATLKIPVFGMLLRKIAVARFTRTLGTLITSGIPLLESLMITARTSGNAYIEKTIIQVRDEVSEGSTLIGPLQSCEVFPNMVVQMIGVGEQTGQMDTMLQKIADFYEEEVDAAVKDMLTLLEPIIICFLGVTVGGVVVSMYLPLFSLIGKLAG